MIPMLQVAHIGGIKQQVGLFVRWIALQITPRQQHSNAPPHPEIDDCGTIFLLFLSVS
jgi:hypothetical protein